MKSFFAMPIRMQLLIMAMVVALPAAAIIIYIGLDQRSDAIHEARTDNGILADSIATEQKSLMTGVEQLVSVLAQLPEVRTRQTIQVQSILSALLGLNPQLLNIFIADQHGAMWVSAKPSNASISIADRRHFINAKDKGTFSSGEYIVGRLLGRPTLSFGYPYRSMNGEFGGVIVVNVDLDYFRNFLVRAKLPRGSSYIILDHHGVILSRGIDPSPYLGKSCPPALFQRIQNGADSDAFIASGIDGVERFISYRKVYVAAESTPCAYIATSVPVAEVVSKANQALFLNLALLIPFMFLAFYLAWFIGRRSILDPLYILRKTTHRLAAGDLEARVGGQVRWSEFGELSRAFDDMAAALASHIAEHERAEKALHEHAVMLEQEVAERQKAQEELALKQQQLEALNAGLEQCVESTISDLRQKDQVLIQQSRQAALGEMINNIAHQWRQPLNNLGLILQNMTDSYEKGEMTPEEMHASSKKAMDTILFMSSTIDDFRFFFRQDKTKRRFVINEVLSRTIDFVTPSLRHSCIDLQVESDEVIEVVGYPNEYSQVLLNIFMNARDAFTERGVGDPLIRIRLFRDNSNHVLAVRDNAGGICEDVMPRIFDPYFTTKEPGKGTGIGLYMSKVIIEQNMGGSLSAHNVDGGTELRIELPA